MPNKKSRIKAKASISIGANDTFCTPDTTKSQVVLVNPELKKLALNYTGAMVQINSEYVQQELPDLCARFMRVENATEALKQVKAFRDYVHGKKASKIKLPSVASSENLPLPLCLILPEIFYWPADDIIKSDKDHDVKRGCDVEAAKLYLAIFERSQFKRLVLSEAKPDKERAELTAWVQQVQKNLVAYLKAMVQQAHPHIVKISAAMEVEVDGKLLEKSSAGKRALLVLALLRNKTSFTTAEFSKIFYGDRKPGDLPAEFSTAIQDARKIVSGLKHASDHKGKRSVSGIYFVVEASEQQLKQTIADALMTVRK
ncbi:MAG: hypothetical protein WCH99_09920 [Verrucomicrobiota bacterium]